MASIFALPDVGEGLTEAEILSWHVAPGDTVTVNQIIVDIETAKAAVELPSPYAGVVSELFEGFFGDVNLMPPEHRDIALAGEQDRGADGRARAVADYIAGMTDRFAIGEHSRLLDPTERT